MSVIGSYVGQYMSHVSKWVIKKTILVLVHLKFEFLHNLIFVYFIIL